MIDCPGYTLTRPPPCPTNRDHLKQPVRFSETTSRKPPNTDPLTRSYTTSLPHRRRPTPMAVATRSREDHNPNR